jgi:hypothetical protein
MLRIEGVNYDRKANGVVETQIHRYTFPVQGKRRRFALMAAVDDSGRSVVLFRRAKWPGQRFVSCEVVVTPGQPVTPELACVIGVASPFLRLYFQSQHGGG